VAALHAIGTRADERFEHETMDPSKSPLSISVEADLLSPLVVDAGSEYPTGIPLRRTSTANDASVLASYAAVVTDLVGALPADDRQPALFV
jgi:hypothetical protein